MQVVHIFKGLEDTLFKSGSPSYIIDQADLPVLDSEKPLHAGKSQIPVDYQNLASHLGKGEGHISNDGALSFCH